MILNYADFVNEGDVCVSAWDMPHLLPKVLCQIKYSFPSEYSDQN